MGPLPTAPFTTWVSWPLAERSARPWPDQIVRFRLSATEGLMPNQDIFARFGLIDRRAQSPARCFGVSDRRAQDGSSLQGVVTDSQTD